MKRSCATPSPAVACPRWITEAWSSCGRTLGICPPPRQTWIHADLHAANIVSAGGLPVGVLDWGEVCAGDPAVDLAMVWALLPDLESVHTCLAAYGAQDDGLLARARAHALLTCAVHATGDQPRIAEAGRRGLRLLGVLEEDAE